MTEKKTILIVDDQESIIKSLRRLLLSEPYDILSAQDGSSALELIKSHQDEIFLIISDQRMPHMTGTMFLEKTVELIPGAIKFILSGYSDRDDVVNALNSGIAHRYLTKPWNNEELTILIHQAYGSPEKIKEMVNSPSVNGASKYLESNIMDMEIRQFNDSRNDRALGKIAVHHGFITQKQLELSFTAMQSARQAGRKVSLENILFEKGLLSSDDMGKIVAATRRKIGKTFGYFAMRDFGVSKTDLDRCFAIQAQEFKDTSTCRLLGDIFVTEKILTEEQKESIIIDQIYSEKDTVSSTIDSDGNTNLADPTRDGSSGEDLKNNMEVRTLNKKKKNFFKQRALDKIFCKSAINRNFATETEILKALEEQLIHFTKTFEIKLVEDILVEHSIISKSQAEAIGTSIGQPHHTQDTLPVENNEEVTQVKGGAPKGLQAAHLQTIGMEPNCPAQDKIIIIANNSNLELTISAGATEATVRPVGDSTEEITLEQLKELLSGQGIIYGLADDVAVELFLRQAATKKESLLIAKGRPVKPGRNGSIRYLFENENDRFGKELASGKFDYRDRGEIFNVTPGTILAEKVPLIAPVSGVTVFGTEILAPLPVDVILDCGQGVELSKDGLKAIAATNGRPDISLGGRITVMSEKIVNGNVDFKTGNIKFNGDVVVQGSILSGFSVTCNNLTVNDIEEADVNIANTLIVKNSIHSSTVKTGGHLTAQIIKNSTLSVYGDVAVQKEIIDCTITTSSSVIIPRGRIVASKIHAEKGVEAMNIGSDLSLPCQLFPGADDHAREILKALCEKIDSQNSHLEQLAEVEKQYQQQSLKQLNELSELSRLQEELSIEKQKALKDKQNTVSDIVKKQMTTFLETIYIKSLKLDTTINKLFDDNDIVQTRIQEVKAKIKVSKTEFELMLNEKKGFETWYELQKQDAKKKGVGVSVHGTLYAGTRITGRECTMAVKSPIKNSRIREAMNSENPGAPLHEMRIEPLSSTGKPHVYRS